MAAIFKFPDVGEGITEGEIVRWLVKEGDVVKLDQALGEIETDKAVVEIPSPYAGKVLKLHGKAGDIIKVGDPLIEIEEEGEQPAKLEKLKQAKQVSKRKSVSVMGELEEAPAEPQPAAIKAKQVLATPKVRALAKELAVDLKQISGSGENGRITAQDVRDLASPQLKISKKYDEYGYIKRIPYKGLRRTVGENMVRSAQTIPHVTHFDKVDVTALWQIREKEKAAAAQQGIKLTYLPFIIKAVIGASKAYPYVNASLNEASAEIILKNYYNIGVAVATEEGLIVPVIKRAEIKSILDTAKEIAELAEKARSRKLDLAELKGGSFTITNVGSIGGYFSTPIINYPEAAILAVHRITDEARLNAQGKWENRKILPLSLSYDHRILDGAVAAAWMNELKRQLEDPDLINRP
ncbi:MAG: hypothetical protein A2788_01785 [Candidatus Abawacabacteria bacterium RIFCSPHIGHO2_01_FULL_46_8]|uniref:Dihydrolipoamide acetyltransferase component of pyruvate dehydrogenase complex n=1 Tax=Candidatus Abawacabacteria bacterium RIFCSPHIGHO2_01_FULL_46_8 TaxID=1817815 RepID=A0A1F4XIP7_9BACT|nr:MAG: hypothetical protein A2788_01785 [Candidatus Abawacabacteria bacterium RIFCSPHIGHO2_01_FULL_46_8]